MRTSQEMIVVVITVGTVRYVQYLLLNKSFIYWPTTVHLRTVRTFSTCCGTQWYTLNELIVHTSCNKCVVQLD